jgi:DNA-binding MarR family transcriptional regulator
MDPNVRKNTVAAWTSLIRASARSLAVIEAALAGANLPPLSWYDALLEIEKAGPDGIRPYVLKERLLLPQYGTSRLLGRLAQAGYIIRTPCDGDGRGHVEKITDEGRRMRQAMWPVYQQSLIDIFEDNIDEKEAEILHDILRRIAN